MADPVLFQFFFSEELNDMTSEKVHTKSEIGFKVYVLISRQTAKL